MSIDPWEHLCFTNTWIMNNFPPIDDYHHFELLTQKEKEYQADLEFYGEQDYEIYSDFTDEYEDFIEDNEDTTYNDSSSESEYDDYEYI